MHEHANMHNSLLQAFAQCLQQNVSDQHHILLWLSSKEYTCNTHVPYYRWYDWHHSVVVAQLLLCDH